MGFWDASGIIWTICRQSVPHFRQITTSSLNFYRPGAVADAQPTLSKHWRHSHFKYILQVVLLVFSVCSGVHCTPVIHFPIFLLSSRPVCKYHRLCQTRLSQFLTSSRNSSSWSLSPRRKRQQEMLYLMPSKLTNMILFITVFCRNICRNFYGLLCYINCLITRKPWRVPPRLTVSVFVFL